MENHVTSFFPRNYVQYGVYKPDTTSLSATLTSKYGAVCEGQKVWRDIDEINRELLFLTTPVHLKGCLMKA
jgi:hypothetical protein